MRGDDGPTMKLGSEFSPTYSELPPREIFVEAAASGANAADADAALNTTATEVSSVDPMSFIPTPPRRFGAYEANSKKAKVFTFEGLTPASTQDDTRQDTGALVDGAVVGTNGSASVRDTDGVTNEEACSPLTIGSNEQPLLVESTFRQKIAAWERQTMTWKARDVYEVPFDEDPMTLDCNSPRSNTFRSKKATTPKSPLQIEATTTESVANTPITGQGSSTTVPATCMENDWPNGEAEVIDLCHHDDECVDVEVEPTDPRDSNIVVEDEITTCNDQTEAKEAQTGNGSVVCQDEQKSPDPSLELEDAVLSTSESIYTNSELKQDAMDAAVSLEDEASPLLRLDVEMTKEADAWANPNNVNVSNDTCSHEAPTTLENSDDSEVHEVLDDVACESEINVQDLTKIDERYDQLVTELSPINEEDVISDDDTERDVNVSNGVQDEMDLLSVLVPEGEIVDNGVNCETKEGLTTQESTIAAAETESRCETAKMDDSPPDPIVTSSVEAGELAAAASSACTSLLDHEEDDEMAVATAEVAAPIDSSHSETKKLSTVEKQAGTRRRAADETAVGCSDDLCNQVSKFLALN